MKQKILFFICKVCFLFEIFVLNLFCKKYKRLSEKITYKEKILNSYKKIFIKTKEDEELNKKLLESKQNEINKLYKKQQYCLFSFQKLLIDYDLIENYSTFIVNCNKFQIKEEKIKLIKEIIKIYLQSD